MSAPSLATLQRWMKARVQPGAPQADEALAETLNPQGGEPGVARLAVYAEGYYARFHEALAEVYEAVQHVVGQADFTRMTRAYAQQYRSHDANLSAVGRHLPEFLAASAWKQRLPFLSDLARLEWAVQDAFHARAEAPLDGAALSQLSPETWAQIRLRFQPFVRLVISAWPIVSIWEARAQLRETVSIPLYGRPQCGLVYRQGYTVCCEAIIPAQQLVLEGLIAGQPLGAVCGELSKTPEGDPRQVNGWFTAWMQAGLIVGYECAIIRSP